VLERPTRRVRRRDPLALAVGEELEGLLLDLLELSQRLAAGADAMMGFTA